MKKSILVCAANGSEEIEVVTTIDILVRANFQVCLVNVNESNKDSFIVCSRGVKILTDVFLSEIIDKILYFDAIVLPGGKVGCINFRKNEMLIECIENFCKKKKLIAAICAAPALFIQYYKLFPNAKMTTFPEMKKYIPKNQWINKKVVYDKSYNLLTSQGPGTSIKFSLKIVEILCNEEVAKNISLQLIL